MTARLNILSLVLDDDTEILEIIEGLLKQHGIINYKLFTKYTDLLEQISGGIYVCVLDHFLTGGKTGLDVCKTIKENSKDSYVIVMTGQQDIKVVIDYLNSCADKYIDKNRKDYLDLLIKYMSEGLEIAKNRLEEVEILLQKRSELKQRRHLYDP